MEAPEPLHRTRPKSRARYDAPVTEPLMYQKEDEEGPDSLATGDKKQGAKHWKERTHGRRRDEQGSEPEKKHRGTKWRQRDIDERRARLDAAGGGRLRLRPVRQSATKAGRGATGRGRR